MDTSKKIKIVKPKTRDSQKESSLKQKSLFSWKPFIPLGILILLTAVYYWPILVCKGFLWNDFLEQNFVYRLFAAVWLKQGVMPFWNPYVFSGMPFFADVQAAVLYPLNLVLTPFATKDWLSPILVEYQIVFHIAMAGCFMYLLAREYGASKSGGLLAGVTFMLCGFFTTHIFHENLVHAAAWFPLVILLFKRTIDRTSLRYAALTALVLTVVFLCGYPQLMVYMYYWLAAYYLYGLVVRIREKTKPLAEVKRAVLFAGLVALGIGMGSVQFLPTEELAKNSVRPKLAFSESCEGSFRPYRFVTLLVPNYFGTPQKNAYWGISEKDVNGGAHNYWETAMYAGTVSLALAAIAPFFVRTPLTVFLSIMAVLSFLLAMGNSFFLYFIAFKFLPAFNAFRIPGRFAFFFSLSVSLLAGLGLTWLQESVSKEDAKRKKLLERALLVTAGICLAWGVIAATGAFKSGIVDFILANGRFGSDGRGIANYVDRQIYPALLKGLWVFVALAVFSAGILVARLRGKLSAKTAAVLLVCLAALDFMAFGMGYASGTIDPAVMYAKTETVRQLQEMEKTEYFRINSRSSNPGTDDLGGQYMAFRKNQGSVHRLFLMEGYNPLRLKRQLVNRKDRTLDILNVKFKIAVDEQRRSMSLALNPTYFPRARMVYGYAVEQDESKILPLLYDSSFDYKKAVVLEEKPALAMDTLGADTAWKCDITDYSLNKIDLEVTSAKNGLLVLSEIDYPSWKATVDGKPAPVLRADYALRAIPVEKGSHKVVCYFSEDVFKKGLVLSLISLLLTLALGVWGWRSERKEKATN
ncbi:MAG TPA: YfhO family protein [Chitinivibrionales bacterium]|nr:YfhO family protein [Chitinivibrionales bacterium]